MHVREKEIFEISLERKRDLWDIFASFSQFCHEPQTFILKVFDLKKKKWEKNSHQSRVRGREMSGKK